MADSTKAKRNTAPLLRIVKRAEMSAGKVALLSAAGLLAGIVVGGLFILMLGQNPFAVYAAIAKGAFRSSLATKGVVKIAVPLLISSLGIVLAFKMKFWNIGAEGQIIMGAVFATYFGVFHADWPKAALLPVMFLAGIVGGGLWGAIPAFFKTKFGTNETLLTLMLNYIALYFLQFFAETKAEWNFFLDPGSARPKFAKFPDNAQMITIPIGPFNLNLSLVIALALCALIFVYLNYTKRGYEIAVVGDSPNTARYAGMRVGTIVLRTIFISAALIGMAGAFHVSSAGVMSASPTNSVGWTGIVVAWLAKLNTVGIVVAALLITVLQFGCQTASATYPAIDANFANLLQGVILFLVLAADFFTRFKLVRRTGKEAAK